MRRKVKNSNEERKLKREKTKEKGRRKKEEGKRKKGSKRAAKCIPVGVIGPFGTLCQILTMRREFRTFYTLNAIAPSSNGKTADSGSAYRGSNPCGAAILHVALDPGVAGRLDFAPAF